MIQHCPQTYTNAKETGRKRSHKNGDSVLCTHKEEKKDRRDEWLYYQVLSFYWQ